MKKRRIGVVADDITGSNDIGIMFSKNGFNSVVATYDIGDVGAYDFADVVILDTDSRFDTSEEAARKVCIATKKLMATGFDMYHNKTCSVFRGNIGAEFDAMQDVLGVTCSMVVLGLPKLGRTTVDGIHYLNGVKLDESNFINDPIHPTHEAELAKILAMQSLRKSAVFTVHELGLPIEEQKNILERMKRENAYVIFDIRNQADLQDVATLIKDEINICGSSGIAEELPGAWGQQGEDAGKSLIHPLEDNNAAFVLAGSLTEATKGQIKQLLSCGWHSYRVEPEELFQGRQDAHMISEATKHALMHIQNRAPFLIYTQNDPIRVKNAKYLAAEAGLDDATLGKRISSIMGSIAQNVVRESGAKKIIVAGGDTSKAVSEALGISHMRIAQEIEPGVPAMYGYGIFGEMLMVLKSGSFGSVGFLQQAVERLEYLAKS